MSLAGVLSSMSSCIFVSKILDSPPVPKHKIHYCNRARWSVNPVCVNIIPPSISHYWWSLDPILILTPWGDSFWSGSITLKITCFLVDPRQLGIVIVVLRKLWDGSPQPGQFSRLWIQSPQSSHGHLMAWSCTGMALTKNRPKLRELEYSYTTQVRY